MNPRLLALAARAPLKLDDLLRLLEPTVTFDRAKQRTKQRVLAQARPQRTRLPRIVTAAALLCAASAAAAGVRGLLGEGDPPAELPPRMIAGIPTPHPAVAQVRSESPSPEDSQPSIGREPPRPEASAPRPAVAKPKLARTAHALPQSKPQPQLRGEDPTRVVQALRALRQQGQPARAGALLERYLEEQPNGALAEEALALSIEAALSENPQRAGALARRYLTNYPQGRYRKVARKALAQIRQYP